MTLQLADDVRNAQCDAIESTIGASPILRIYDSGGSVPADESDAAAGTVLAEMTLPSDWLSDASGGSKSLLGTWEDSAADAGGTADYFRIYESTGTTPKMQGTVTGDGGGGDLELDNTNISSGQKVTITSFSLTEGNA